MVYVYYLNFIEMKNGILSCIKNTNHEPDP